MKQDERAVVIYATFASPAEAQTIGKALVGQGLAACVNILGSATAIYEWQGKLEHAQEVAMLIKTRAALAKRVVAEVEDRHSYDTPAVLVLDVAGGSAGYLDWLVAQAGASN